MHNNMGRMILIVFFFLSMFSNLEIIVQTLCWLNYDSCGVGRSYAFQLGCITSDCELFVDINRVVDLFL